MACDIASALPHEGLKVEDRALDFGPLKSFLQSRTVSEEVMYVRSIAVQGDITGVVFEVDPDAPLALQRLILSDGDGRSPKPFKSEWATEKARLET